MIKTIFSLRNIFYFCYAFCLLLVLLYVRFPAEKFKLYCERHVEYYFNLTACSIGGIKYKYPSTLTFSNIRLVSDDDSGQNSTVVLPEVAITPRLKKLGKRFMLKGSAYGGTFASDLNIESEAELFQLENFVATGVQIEKLTESMQLTERAAQGNLKFAGSYEAPFSKPFTGKGKGEIAIVKGSFQLIQPVLGLAQIEFDNIRFQLSQAEELITIAGGTIASEAIKAQFQGEVTLDEKRVDSRLRLNGSIEPSKTLVEKNPASRKYVKYLERRYKTRELPFQLGGTLKIPTFRFGN